MTLINDGFRVCLPQLPHFKMYTQYCYNYPNALATMTKLTEENSKFKSFIKKAESIMQKRFMDVLITPVQRVPRYVLLLDTLIKHTSDDHPDYAQLKKAHEQAQNAANGSFIFAPQQILSFSSPNDAKSDLKTYLCYTMILSDLIRLP
jgi:hypothetical protein